MQINLRFGMHKDIQLIHDSQDLLDGMVIPANILAHQAASTSVFISSVPGLPYFIDPMTYLLQHRSSELMNEKGEIRLSVGKLLDDYHVDLADKLVRLRDIRPKDFPKTEAFCEGVVAFQQTKVVSSSETSAATKYLKRYNNTSATLPATIVPPYFKFHEVGDDWYDYSLKCSKYVLGNVSNCTPVICCEANSLSPKAIATLTDDYSDFETALIWADGYSGHLAATHQILSCRKLYDSLTRKGCTVQVLYGGYLSILSKQDGVRGISHGILYTEHRSTASTPGAGGAPERYYIPRIHSFRSLSQTDLILHKHPELICDCPVCQEYLGDDPDNIILFRDNPELLRKHFLQVRRREADEIESGTLANEIARMRETYKKYNDSFKSLPNPDAFVTDTPMQGLEYLKSWSDAFSSSIGA